MRVADRRRRGRGDSGVTAVEFAIAVPILLVLIIGMLEFAFVMRDYLSVSSSARVGVRVAATGASAGQNPCPGGAFDCSAADVPRLAQLAADAIQQDGTGMPQDYIKYILVYKANDKGFPGSSGNTTMPSFDGCQAAGMNCIAFRWAPSINRFVRVGGSWDSSTIYACPPTSSNVDGPDSVGVFMRAEHPYLSRLFGSSLSITNRAVMQFEPLPVNQCASGQHQ